MSTIANELDETLRRLDPETALLLERFVRNAVALAERRSASRGEQVDALGYPLGYFEATAGSFADEPLEVPVELPAQVRESW